MARAPTPRSRLAAAVALALLALAAVALRLESIHTTAAHWDELSLLARTRLSDETGVLNTGGRPGLAVLVLLPFVRGCADELATLAAARSLWLGITLAYLLGVAALAAAAQPDPARRRGDAAWAVGLLALTPAFLEWSIQVRTDQLALAGACWSGAALLASRRRPALSLLSGALLALGYLASQKAYYAGAAGVVLAAGDLLGRREWRPRRELLRGAGLVAGYLALVQAYRLGLELWFQLPAQSPARALTVTSAQLQSAIDHFDFYRRSEGFRQVESWLPGLLPHAVLLAGAGLASWKSRVQRVEWLTSAALLTLGAGILVLHGARFAYFWMTVGIFPALALARVREPALGALAPAGGRGLRLAGAGLWAVLCVQALSHAGFMLVDTQRVQRDSIAFVHRNFSPRTTGFLAESRLYCTTPDHILRSFFAEDLYRQFGGAAREANIATLLEQFRRAPVAYLIHSFRLNQFPVELRRFLAENYQPYRGSVFVAGRELLGGRQDSRDFELIVPGEYRWIPFERPAPLEIGGARVEAGDVLALAPGAHTARFPEDATRGVLVLALADPPGQPPATFYKQY